MAYIFGYKGHLGISGWNEKIFKGEANPGDFTEVADGEEQFTKAALTDALVNDPLQPGQLGFVCNLAKCKFNAEAIELLKKVKKGRDDIGDIMCFGDTQNATFGWMGGIILIGDPSDNEFTSDRDTNWDLLPEPVEFDLPEAFKEAVDGIIAGK